MKLELSEFLRIKLLKMGWSEERNVDISNEVREMAGYGWSVFENASDFLTSFSGLSSMPPNSVDYVDFDSTYAGDDIDFEKFKKWVKNTNTLLFPIGTDHGWLLFIGNDNVIYESDEKKIWRLGDTLEESLESLFIRKSRSLIFNL
jgi:hypothetical protein